jgi:hypothetical protein
VEYVSPTSSHAVANGCIKSRRSCEQRSSSDWQATLTELTNVPVHAEVELLSRTHDKDSYRNIVVVCQAKHSTEGNDAHQTCPRDAAHFCCTLIALHTAKRHFVGLGNCATCVPFRVMQ